MTAFGLEERQQILEDLLAGPALGRSEQLRQLLRYIAAEEAAGRGHELSEYSIGVHGLGRPPDYAPDVDSTVRTRVHELRRRLEEHYRRDPEAEWRVELPKGTYRLRFTRQVPNSQEPPALLAPEERLEIPPSVPVHSTAPAASWLRFWSGMVAGVILVFVAVVAVRSWTPANERAAREIWGPILEKGGVVTLVLATPPQLWVREFGADPLPVGDPPAWFSPPASPEFRQWYERMVQHPPNGAMLHPNNHSPLGGEAHAAIFLAGFAAERGARVELLAGERIGAAEIRERNAVVLGRAEYSRAAASLQPAKGWAVRYLPERRQVGIVLPDGSGFFREQAGATNYGLVTVLTKHTDAGPRRTFLFAGINSDGSEAAMTYFTSLRHLQELASALHGGGKPTPDAYQVVVRSRSADTRSLGAERAALRILQD